MPKKRLGRPQTLAGIAQLAARQHGVVAVGQLYSLGLSERQVRRRVEAGWLHRLHRGVYVIGPRELTDHGRWMAAVLACGKGAVLSHHAAAELWELRRSRRAPHGDTRIHVAIPSQRGVGRRTGLIVHRVPTLHEEEATTRFGIPVTAPPRTLLDLATLLPRRPLERAIDEAERLRLCGQEELETIAARHAGRAGAGVLAAVLGEHRPGSTATRSELEERFLGLCHAYHLPQPEVNVPLLDYVVDFLWRDSRLVVEVDGHASHGTRRAFQADRDRDGRLMVAGYRVLRFTWWDVVRRSAVVADRVRRMLR